MDEDITLVRGDATEPWALDDNTLDSIVTDPPYGIAFMGKSWDDKGGPAAYQAWTATWASEAYRTLKPGGFLLAFGATRMAHRMACGFEDAGFEIVDTIEWLYLTGFPKAQDIGKMFDKRDGAERTVVVEGERSATRPHVPDQSRGKAYRLNGDATITAPATELAKRWDGWKTPALKPAHEPIVVARKPFSGTYTNNIERWSVGAINVDGCRVGGAGEGGTREGESSADRRYTEKGSTNFAATPGPRGGDARGRFPANVVTLDDDAWFSPYFNITPQELSKKASPSEKRGDGWKNTHPTVKPVALIRWLQRLVTPPNGLIASPFLGSGTDAVAAIHEGFRFFGIEREESYWSIIDARIAEAKKNA